MLKVVVVSSGCVVDVSVVQVSFSIEVDSSLSIIEGEIDFVIPRSILPAIDGHIYHVIVIQSVGVIGRPVG